jgi:hypothetical protein
LTRSYFSLNQGFRAPRGGPIIDLQKGLALRGDFPLSLDGIFASQTVQALKLWQTKSGMSPSGAVDTLSWIGLTGTDMPRLFRRCLSLTAAFEGHGYTLAVGNFDGAGITWGIIGFTLVTGDLGKVLKMINARSPQTMLTAFGFALDEVMSILDAPEAQKIAWADRVSLGASKAGLRADIKDAFEQLGNQQVAREVQDRVARDHYWQRAVSDTAEFGKPTELDAAIFFDTAVQSGGVNATKAVEIKAVLAAASPKISTRDRLVLMAPALATGVKQAYIEDVVSRRKTIASGRGTVHGAQYDVSCWGLDDFTVSASDQL